MIISDQPRTVTLVASPPPATDNGALDQTYQLLVGKALVTHQIFRVSSVRDIDLALCQVINPPLKGAPAARSAPPFKGTFRLQIIGHSIPGSMCLGATWTDSGIHDAAAFAYPFLVLDTSPAALGLLAKFAGKISEVMLVGCHVGSTTSFGHAINGRTLTYTLAELLRCKVSGADDDVAPDEYDAQGWYAPSSAHRLPKGWRWNDSLPPSWSDPGLDPLPRNRKPAGHTFEIRALRSIMLPMLPMLATADSTALVPPVKISCSSIAVDKLESGLPELTVETDQGIGQIVGGGRYLLLCGTCYVVDRNPQLQAALAAVLRSAEPANRDQGSATSATG